MAEKTRTQLERELLPRFIARQRWYAAKGEALDARRAGRPRRARRRRANSWLLALADAHGAVRRDALLRAAGARLGGRATRSACASSAPRRSPRCASRPASACWPTPSPTRRSAARSCARSAAARALTTAGGSAALHARRGRSRGSPATRWSTPLPVRRRRASSNTVSLLGERLFLKGYRRLRAGDQPRARDRPLPHRRGALRALRAGGRQRRVRRPRRRARRRSRCCRRYVTNQGDGWAFTLELSRAHARDRRARSANAARRRRRCVGA